eukprot:9048003-Lingulodinium_polyedra.AAC.1
MAATKVAKNQQPRNWFKEHGKEPVSRYGVFCAAKHHRKEGVYVDPKKGKLSNLYQRKAETS